MIGRPGAPLPGCFAPSQAQTVAPTSPNSPSSWIRPGGVLAGRVREQQRVLARVVGRRRRRVAAVVGGEDQEVAVAQRVEDVRQPPVEVLEAAVEVDRVVAVAPELVRLDEVHEDEAGVDVLEQLDRAVDPVDVRLRRERLVDVAPREDVGDLPDAVDGVAGVADRRSGSSGGAARARSRGGSACARSARLAEERPRDHPPDRVLPVRISRATRQPS